MKNISIYSTIASSIRPKFDTLTLYNKIKDNKLEITEESIHAIIQAFGKMLDDKIYTCTNSKISKASYERNIYLHRIDFTNMKNIIQQAQKNEIVSNILACEALLRELNLLRNKIREKMVDLKSESRLEMDLDKRKTRNFILNNNLKYQDLYSKIDMESLNGFVLTGKLRHDILYSISGLLFTGAAALLGYLRYYG